MKKANGYFYSALICAAWFFLTCTLWTYMANVFLALPAGLISLLLWNSGRKLEGNSMRMKIIPIILMTGVLLSMGALFYFVAYE